MFSELRGPSFLPMLGGINFFADLLGIGEPENSITIGLPLTEEAQQNTERKLRKANRKLIGAFSAMMEEFSGPAFNGHFTRFKNEATEWWEALQQDPDSVLKVLGMECVDRVRQFRQDLEGEFGDRNFDTETCSDVLEKIRNFLDAHDEVANWDRDSIPGSDELVIKIHGSAKDRAQLIERLEEAIRQIGLEAQTELNDGRYHAHTSDEGRSGVMCSGHGESSLPPHHFVPMDYEGPDFEEVASILQGMNDSPIVELAIELNPSMLTESTESSNESPFDGVDENDEGNGNFALDDVEDGTPTEQEQPVGANGATS